MSISGEGNAYLQVSSYFICSDLDACFIFYFYESIGWKQHLQNACEFFFLSPPETLCSLMLCRKANSGNFTRKTNLPVLSL